MLIKIIDSSWYNNETNQTEFNIYVECGKYKIEVSKNSEKWNNDGINDFLTSIAVAIPEGEKFEIEKKTSDDIKIESTNIFNYVCELFQSFVDEYNKNISL